MGGFFSPPKAVGVSACEISRIGTRRSAREPSTWILREFGSGAIAASSTCAFAAMNFSGAFMAFSVSVGSDRARIYASARLRKTIASM